MNQLDTYFARNEAKHTKHSVLVVGHWQERQTSLDTCGL